MRIATYNVQNLFDRAAALSMRSWTAARPTLEAHAEINALFQLESYSQSTKQRILELLEELGLLRSDAAAMALLRVIRGRLLRRPREGSVEVVADGRADWIGWVELTTEPVDDLAIRHTAMVVRDVGADVLGVVEVEDRTVLRRFSESLTSVGGTPYEQPMLIDGNDDRGIDVGVLTRVPIEHVRSHVFDVDDEGLIFSRDCAEYHLRTEGGLDLVVLVNHFKSKGFSEPGDRLGNRRRRRQAERVAAVYATLRNDDVELVAIVGDFNDSPDSEPLAPLLTGTDLRDISEHPAFEFGTRRGTFRGGNESSKLDYVLLSPALFERASGGAIVRTGVWHGPRTDDPWDIYATMTAEVHAASDHAAIYADVDLA